MPNRLVMSKIFILIYTLDIYISSTQYGGIRIFLPPGIFLDLGGLGHLRVESIRTFFPLGHILV